MGSRSLELGAGSPSSRFSLLTAGAAWAFVTEIDLSAVCAAEIPAYFDVNKTGGGAGALANSRSNHVYGI